MEMLDEEIKVAVAKEMEAEKASRRMLEGKKMGGSARFKPILLGRFPAEKSADEEEPILDRRTARKVERISQGRDKCRTAIGANRKIISEILDVGRLDFLKTQRAAVPSAGLSRQNFNIPSTAGTPWNSARNRTACPASTRAKFFTPFKKPETERKPRNWQDVNLLEDPREKQKKKAETIARMQKGKLQFNLVELKGVYTEFKEYHKNRKEGTAKQAAPKAEQRGEAEQQKERVKLRTAPNLHLLAHDNRLDALLKFDQHRPYHRFYKEEPNLNIGNIWKAARKNNGLC